MMCTLASSSSGNSALISDGATHILIDAGISARRISGELKKLGVEPRDIAAILITHEHSDHICGLGTFLKRFPVPVYSSLGTAAALRGLVPPGLLSVFEGERFSIGGAAVEPFDTPHDACQSVGYMLTVGGRCVVVATDLGCVPQRVLSYIDRKSVV